VAALYIYICVSVHTGDGALRDGVNVVGVGIRSRIRLPRRLRDLWSRRQSCGAGGTATRGVKDNPIRAHSHLKTTPEYKVEMI
jgi:hypothetical protein